MKNLRVRMTVMIVLVVLVSTSLLFLLSYQRARDSMSAQMEQNYSIVADKYSQELTAWVNSNAAIVDSMAAEITVSGIYKENYETFHRYLSESRELLDKEDVIYDIYFTYPDNIMVCASDYISDGSVDYSHDREWFVTAAGTGELFYSSPYRDVDSGKSVITISRGVYEDNVLQGVLAADIFVDVLIDIISDAEVAQNSYAFLVDQNLGMIVHPNEAYAFDDVPHGVMDIPDAPYADVISKIRSGSSETVYLNDYDGIMRGVVVSRMANTGWYVGIATKKDELTRDFGPLIRGFLIAAAIAVVIGCAFAVFLAHVLDKLSRQQQEYEDRVQKLEKQVKEEKRKGSHFFRPDEKEVEFVKTTDDKSVPGRFRRIVPILLIFFLMICMVLYTTRVITDVSALNIREVGEDRISVAAAELENYLGTAKSTLWVTADTVDHMIHNGASARDVLDYITVETQNQKDHFDVNINGFYGYVMGKYIDGLNWAPPENYDPTRRDWYLAAIAAEGESTIVSPYMDAQTDDMIISISRMLSNGTDVLSLDIFMNHIQEIVSSLQIKEKGYGFIVDSDGMLIAHRDEEKKGRYLTEEEDKIALFDQIKKVQSGYFEITADRRQSTVFVRQITDQWYAVIVISNAELMSEVWQQLIINFLICILIFLLIALFYLISRRTEKNYSLRIEQMRAEEQKQAYEAQMLKLEKEAADRANQAKSDFLANMSHEIRTPINAVLGMNEMIRRETDKARETTSPDRLTSAFNNISIYSGNIESAGNNLLSIINDILDLSKIEAGQMQLVPGEYKLSSVLIDVCNAVSFKAGEKGLEFQVDVDKTIPDRLYGDKVRVRQIMTNLLSNALKYTNRGSIQLIVRMESENIEAGQTIRLVISIKDTGIGIREEDIDRLFSKFQRIDLEKNSTVEGTGLGLAITQTLVSMMGGDIRVESTYGVGSTFTVILPQVIVSAEPMGNYEKKFEKNIPGAAEYHESFRAPGARILIVDDTRMNLMVATGLLKDTQMQIDKAGSGAEAIELTLTTPYDLILMDQRMPKMDGTEALRRIREQQDGANRQTPIICLTADAVIGAKEKYLSEGFTDYLTKPIDSAALEKVLVQYLPSEKVEITKNTNLPVAAGPPETGAGDQYAPLRAAGIQTETALKYCQGDEEFYRTLLREYAQSAVEKAPDMQRLYAAHEWKEYAIVVHALKSSSKIIGAVSLSETAAHLEAAANQNREDDIISEHRQMMCQYDAVVKAIRSICGEEDPPAFDEDEEVMEFFPEE